MADPRLNEWGNAVAEWAAQQPEIGAVWFFGSRTTNAYRADSDLDIAVIMRDGQRPSPERLSKWLFCAEEWRKQLSAILAVPVDLQLGDADLAEIVVAPAIELGGIKIFPAQGS